MSAYVGDISALSSPARDGDDGILTRRRCSGRAESVSTAPISTQVSSLAMIAPVGTLRRIILQLTAVPRRRLKLLQSRRQRNAGRPRFRPAAPSASRSCPQAPPPPGNLACANVPVRSEGSRIFRARIEADVKIGLIIIRVTRREAGTHGRYRPWRAIADGRQAIEVEMMRPAPHFQRGQAARHQPLSSPSRVR